MGLKNVIDFDDWFNVLGRSNDLKCKVSARSAWEFQQAIIEDLKEQNNEMREILIEVGRRSHRIEKLHEFYCREKD